MVQAGRRRHVERSGAISSLPLYAFVFCSSEAIVATGPRINAFVSQLE